MLMVPLATSTRDMGHGERATYRNFTKTFRVQPVTFQGSALILNIAPAPQPGGDGESGSDLSPKMRGTGDRGASQPPFGGFAAAGAPPRGRLAGSDFPLGGFLTAFLSGEVPGGRAERCGALPN